MNKVMNNDEMHEFLAAFIKAAIKEGYTYAGAAQELAVILYAIDDDKGTR